MTIDAAAVRKTAKLAGLRIKEADVDRLAQELDTILGWVEQLNEVDVEGGEPMIGPISHALPMRADVVSDGFQPGQVLSNAPARAGGYFVVPKVLE